MSLTLWDDLLPQLRRWLSVGPLRPHLKRRGLLTDEEYDGLLSRVEEPPGVQAEHLVVILRKKGRQGPNLFLQALQDSLTEPEDYHRGHVELAQLVEEWLQHVPSAPASTPVPEQATLNTPCSEQALWSCSRELHSWEGLALALGFSSADIYALRRDHQETSEQRQQLLLRWRRRLGSAATFQALMDAAIDSGDQRFAEIVRSTASRLLLDTQTLPGTTSR